MKDLVFADVEFYPTEKGIACRFYWKFHDSEQTDYIDNPSVEWLKDFVSEDKPYEICEGYLWHKAVDWAIARISEAEINKQLAEKGIISDEELTSIIEKTYNEYFPEMGKWRLFDSDQFLDYLGLKAEKMWKKKGE